MHAPTEQTRPPVHTLPQTPQFAPSVSVLTQSEPHAVCPDGHESTQAPP